MTEHISADDRENVKRWADTIAHFIQGMMPVGTTTLIFNWDPKEPLQNARFNVMQVGEQDDHDAEARVSDWVKQGGFAREPLLRLNRFRSAEDEQFTDIN